MAHEAYRLRRLCLGNEGLGDGLLPATKGHRLAAVHRGGGGMTSAARAACRTKLMRHPPSGDGGATGGVWMGKWRRDGDRRRSEDHVRRLEDHPEGPGGGGGGQGASTESECAGWGLRVYVCVHVLRRGSSVRGWGAGMYQKGGREGGGGGWLGPCSSYGLPMVPAEGEPKIVKLKSSWCRRCRSKILAVSLKHWKGRRGGAGPGGGGG